MESRYCSDKCNTFILYRNEKTGTFGVDGCHGPDKDLTMTYQLLDALPPRSDLYYKLVIDDGWPTLTDITAEVKAAASGTRVFDPTLANIVRHQHGMAPLPDEDKDASNNNS